MITKPKIERKANEAFALADLLEVAFGTAHKAIDENRGHEEALVTVKSLLFIASNTCSDMAHALSEMISECAPTKEAKK